MSDVVTTKEAADILGIAQESVTRLIRRGTLRADRFGSVWMIYRESVVDYQKKTQGKSRNDPTRTKTKN